SLFYDFFFTLYFPHTTKMRDTDSITSDDSDTEYFPEDFLNNIPEDSKCSDEDEGSDNDIDSSSLPLNLEVGLKLLTWKSAYNHIKKWSLQQGFSIRKGRTEKLQGERRKQIILCRC